MLAALDVMSDGGQSADIVVNDVEDLGGVSAAAYGRGNPRHVVDSMISDTDQLEDGSSSTVQGDNSGDGGSTPAIHLAFLTPTLLANLQSERGVRQMQHADMSDEDVNEPQTPRVPPDPVGEVAVPAQRCIAVIEVIRDEPLSTPRFRRHIIVVPQKAD